MGWISIFIPEANENIYLNPSAEADGNYAASGATVTRDTAHSRFGCNAYKIVMGGANQGVNLTTKAATNAGHYHTFYVWGTVTGSLQISMNGGTNWNTAAIVGGSTGGWVRYGVSIPQAQANGSTRADFRDTASDGTIWVDGFQAEAKAYYTSYTDGDQDGCRWSGLRHAGVSTRSAQYRLGGREQDLLTTYAITVRQMAGYGLPPIQNNTMPYSLLPGAEFQSDHIGQRTIVLTCNLNDATIPLLQSKRKKLMNFLYPGAYAGAQEVLLGFKSQHTGRTVYGKFRYAGGLEGQSLQAGGSAVEGNADTKVTLTACDPFYYEDNAEAAALVVQRTVTTDTTCAVRVDGVWQAMGANVLSQDTNCILVDKQRHRIYIGTNGTTAGGVTINYFGYYDGSANTFVAVGGATKGTNGNVSNLALAPNGDVWGVGAFTQAGGSATKSVFRYNVAADTFTVFNLSGTGAWYQVAIDTAGKVYLGGTMVNWNGDAAQDYITVYDPDAGTWAALGTSPFSANEYPFVGGPSMGIDPAGRLVVASYSAAGTAGALRRWSGTAWSLLASTDTSGNLRALLIRADGTYIVGGAFTTLGGVTCPNAAQYSGSAVAAILGVAAASTITCIAEWQGLCVLVADAGTVPLQLWNGYSLLPMDAAPGSAWINAATAYEDELYIAGDVTWGGVVCAGQTTLAVTCTAETKPKIYLTSGTSAYCTVAWLENVTTSERLYLGLTLRSGEIVTIDCASQTVISDWRGEITSQPLEGSDWSDFHLQPGSNVIACYYPYTGASANATAVMTWPVTHNAIDGGAA